MYAFCVNNPVNLWDLLGMKPLTAPQVGAKEEELIQTLEDGTKVWKQWEASPDGYDWMDVGDFVEMPAFEVKENMPEPAVFPEPIFEELVAMAPVMDLGADIAQAVLDNYSILNPANLTVQGVAKLGAKAARRSGKERATDRPSWSLGERPQPNENGRDFANRLLDEKYGAGNYDTGPGTEFSKLKKFGDRGGD